MLRAKSSLLHLMFWTTALLALPSLMGVQYGYSQTAAVKADGISILSSSSFTDDTGAYHIRLERLLALILHILT
jgi:hypothetical protein